MLLSGAGTDRPGTVFIGRVSSMDYSGMQVAGRWHRRALKDDGQKEVPVGTVDVQVFFPWTSLDYVEILPESDERESRFAEQYRLGMQSLKAGDYPAAIRYFQDGLVLKPGDSKTQYYLEEAEKRQAGG